MAPRTRASTSALSSPALDAALPEELLSTICSFSPQSSLLNLAQCSKTLHRIAIPHLYAHISFRTWESPFLLPFAWRVFTSAQHAKYVRSLAVSVASGMSSPVDVWDDDDREAKRPWLASSRGRRGGSGDENAEEENKQMVEKTLKKVCVQHTIDEQDAEEMFNMVKSGGNDIAIVVLMIAHLHNLRTLDFCYCSISTSKTLLRALDLVTRGPRSLKSGQSSPQQDHPLSFSKPLDIMVSGDDDKYPNHSLHVAAFLNLPNIRSLYAWKSGDSDWDDSMPRDDAFFKLKPRSCAVEYMELRCSKLYHEHFDYLLNALIPAKLKTFIYEVGCTWAWVSVHHKKMIESLAPHYETLECLEFSHESFYPYQFGNDTEEPVPISFKCFQNLKKLKVAPVYIWGEGPLDKEAPNGAITKRDMLQNALPGTLEELWITRVDTEHRNTHYIQEILLPALSYVVGNSKSDFPQLTRLYLTFSGTDPYLGWLNALYGISLVAKNYGITVFIKLCGDSRQGFDEQRRWGWYEEVEWEWCYHNSGCFSPAIVVADYDDEDGLWEALKEYGVGRKAEWS